MSAPRHRGAGGAGPASVTETHRGSPGVSGEYPIVRGPQRRGSGAMPAVRVGPALEAERARLGEAATSGTSGCELDLGVAVGGDDPEPPPSQREIDPELFFEDEAGPELELDLSPASERAPRRDTTNAIPPPASGELVAVTAPRDAFVTFGFGPPPDSPWAAPGYALRVLSRRKTLMRELAIARRRRSPDVAVYEAALRTADERAVRLGLAIASAVCGLVFFAAAAAVALWLEAL